MEFWESPSSNLTYNLTTTDRTQWVELMNRSTAEWGIGWLPPNVVAIPGPMNDSWALEIPAGSMVISNAAGTRVGSWSTETVVLAITSGIALIWAFGYVTATWKSRSRDLSHRDIYQTAVPGDLENARVISVEAFWRLVLDFYSEDIRTEVELYEENYSHEELKGGEVEAVTDLVRRMYELDLHLWSLQSAQHVTEADREGLRVRSDATLAEVRRLVAAWDSAAWGDEEQGELGGVANTLFRMLPTKRYGRDREAQIPPARLPGWPRF